MLRKDVYGSSAAVPAAVWRASCPPLCRQDAGATQIRSRQVKSRRALPLDLLPKPLQHFFRRGELRPEFSQFRDCALTLGRIKGLNGIFDDGHVSAALQQSFRCQTNTVLRDHSKHQEFGFARKTLHQYRRMPALENVQRLLFEE